MRLTAVVLARRKAQPYIDNLVIDVKGGRGGAGLAKIGGVGGAGGDVILRTAKGASLMKLARDHPSGRLTAPQGKGSKVLCQLGERGANMVIKVPVGITLSDPARPRDTIAELDAPDQEVIVARGGPGGSDETNFHPPPVEGRKLRLDLKLIADVGLVGFPNAGKSTLLRALSKARPKVASYPFTTMRPHLGHIVFDDSRRISVADLPGLIEGAHAGIGLGFDFLKHVERTRLLLFVVDVFGFQLRTGEPFRTALENVLLLNRELELYDDDLLNKPAILCLNKVEENKSKGIEVLEEIQHRMEETALERIPEVMRPQKHVCFQRTICISAKEKLHTNELAQEIRTVLDIHDAENRRLNLNVQNKH